MTIELKFLVWVAAFTMVMWVPYILNTIAVRGLKDAVGYPEHPKPLAAWASRLKAAHYNAIENLAVFATLVLATQFAGISNETTVLACSVYLWARVAHAAAYALGIPWVRTLAFAAGFFCQLLLALQLLGG